MPFRRWFAERGASHPTAYSMLTLAGGMLVCMIIAVLISVQASNRAVQQNLAQERKQELAAEEKARQLDRAQEEEAHAAACLVITTQAEVFRETKPTTAAGKAAAQAWIDLSVTFRCQKG